jgi:hypothetical protein
MCNMFRLLTAILRENNHRAVIMMLVHLIVIIQPRWCWYLQSMISVSMNYIKILYCSVYDSQNKIKIIDT